MRVGVYLERSGAQLQALLHVLLQLVLDADLLLFGERRHREGSDHDLLANWMTGWQEMLMSHSADTFITILLTSAVSQQEG